MGSFTPWRISYHVTSMQNSERYAKAIECSRYSGQMRLPSAMRFTGMRKMRDVAESMACRPSDASVCGVAPKRMSLSGLYSCPKRKRKCSSTEMPSVL